MHDASWSVTFTEIDEAPASVLFDTRWLHAPLPAHATEHYAVALAMAEAGEHGLGTEEEAVRLSAVEAALWACLEAAGMVAVARVRHDGWWVLHAHGPPGVDLEVLVPEIVGDVPFDLHTAHDPDGAAVREQVLPDVWGQIVAQSLQLVAALVEAGDPLVTPREVEHSVYFRDAGDRDAFAAAAGAAGFDVHFGHWMADADDEGDDTPPEEPFSALVVGEHAVDAETVTGTARVIFELAGRHGGTYDGWECEVHGAHAEA